MCVPPLLGLLLFPNGNFDRPRCFILFHTRKAKQSSAFFDVRAGIIFVSQCTVSVVFGGERGTHIFHNYFMMKAPRPPD